LLVKTLSQHVLSLRNRSCGGKTSVRFRRFSSSTPTRLAEGLGPIRLPLAIWRFAPKNWVPRSRWVSGLDTLNLSGILFFVKQLLKLGIFSILCSGKPLRGRVALNPSWRSWSCTASCKTQNPRSDRTPVVQNVENRGGPRHPGRCQNPSEQSPFDYRLFLKPQTALGAALAGCRHRQPMDGGPCASRQKRHGLLRALAVSTLLILRDFWKQNRNSVWIFPKLGQSLRAIRRSSSRPSRQSATALSLLHQLADLHLVRPACRPPG